MDETKEMAIIPIQEYEQLKEAANLLRRLYAAGVDNWDGWDYAIEECQDDAD